MKSGDGLYQGAGVYCFLIPWQKQALLLAVNQPPYKNGQIINKQHGAFIGESGE